MLLSASVNVHNNCYPNVLFRRSSIHRTLYGTFQMLLNVSVSDVHNNLDFMFTHVFCFVVHRDCTRVLTGSGSSSNAAKVMVLLTDGDPTIAYGDFENGRSVHKGSRDSGRFTQTTTRATQAKDMGITIATVGIGRGLNEQYLRSISSSDGGTPSQELYEGVTDFDQLTNSIDRLIAKVACT